VDGVFGGLVDVDTDESARKTFRIVTLSVS
jgi:hypothetical protein